MIVENVYMGQGYFHRRELFGFDELVTFADRVSAGKTGKNKNLFNGMGCDSLIIGNKRWAGTDSLEEAIQLARFGWIEGRTQIESISAKIDIERLLPSAFRATIVYDLAGDEPDIARFLSGEPEHMRTFQPLECQKGKLFRLVVAAGYDASTTIHQVYLRGAAIRAALDVLRLLGYTLDVLLAFTAYRGVHAYELYVPLHRAGDYFQLDQFTFGLVHPSVLRRLVLAMWECEDKNIRNRFGFFERNGYGTPKFATQLPTHDYYLTRTPSSLEGIEDAQNLAREILKACGIILQPYS